VRGAALRVFFATALLQSSGFEKARHGPQIRRFTLIKSVVQACCACL
jgi:hypothetical protein